ncbi:MAG: sulfite exporter TauE/SafE family protein [Chitinophagaceae bacterium]
MNIWLAAITTGFTIGIIGNIHCIAMCGPLALSIPIQHFNPTKKNSAIILYNFGRTVSYTFLGLIFGLVGNSFSFFGLQQVLSIVGGIVLLLLTFSQIFSKYNIPMLKIFTSFIQQQLKYKLQQKTSIYSLFSIGILNGLLPCGLVYIGITTAIAIGNVYYAMLVMFSFGLGTFPLMISLFIFGNNIPYSFRLKLKKLTPFFVSLLAGLLIVRGMNLNIPFVSPYIKNQTTNNIVKCH